MGKFTVIAEHQGEFIEWEVELSILTPWFSLLDPISYLFNNACILSDFNFNLISSFSLLSNLGKDTN